MRRAVLLLALVCVGACANPENEPQKLGIHPVYDGTTGKLKELTYDSNKRGRVNTWTEMDGARPISTRVDRNGDGKLDRWEYYNGRGELVKVGFSRSDDGKPDAWAYSGADGRIERIEISSIADEKTINRWEHYDASGLVSAEEDTNADGVIDTWTTFERGALKTAAFDDTGDGKPHRRMTYERGALVLIETGPDASGRFTKGAVRIPGGLVGVVPARRGQATGGIEGVAQSAARRNLPGVWVQARRSNGDLASTTITSSTGSFSFTNLMPDDYTIEVLDGARGKIVGTSALVTVTAGATATVTVTVTASGAIAEAGGGGLSLFGLGPIATVAVVGGAAATTIVAIRAAQSDASPSR